MRKHYLDNIRFSTVLLVLVYHVFYLFNHAGVLGNVMPLQGTAYMDGLLYFVYPWFMVLLFVVAGASSRYALEHRGTKQFMKDRACKLLVPSTLGLFVYQWIGGYLNLLNSGVLGEIPSPLHYLIAVLSGTGPLWFIQMLFLFLAILLLVRKLDASDKLWTLCGKANLVILLLLSVLIWGSAQILNAPVITTYRFGIYLIAFMLGYFFFSHDEIIERLEKAGIPLVIVAIAMGIAYVIYFFGSNYASDECLKSLFTNMYLWITVLAIFAGAKKWFNTQTSLTAFLSQRSFGWYIVHYPIVLFACYMLAHYTKLPALLIYLSALLFELIVTYLVYEILSRIPVIRFLTLGIKKKADLRIQK